jgi:hypothetical protein
LETKAIDAPFNRPLIPKVEARKTDRDSHSQCHARYGKNRSDGASKKIFQCEGDEPHNSTKGLFKCLHNSSRQFREFNPGFPGAVKAATKGRKKASFAGSAGVSSALLQCSESGTLSLTP